jgi:hypothetical protein
VQLDRVRRYTRLAVVEVVAWLVGAAIAAVVASVAAETAVRIASRGFLLLRKASQVNKWAGAASRTPARLPIAAPAG